MATLQDIAERCGVSTVTVSNVLRGKIKGSWPSSAARIQRVREVADELGYRVDWRARALKTKRTYMIGLLSTDKPETHDYDPRVLTPLIETLGEAGYQVAFVRVGDNAPAGGFADARFDGLLIDYHVEPEELRIIQQSQTPAVIINAPSPIPDHAVSVMPDHLASGRLAARYLLDLGHERIGFVEASETEQTRWPSHMYDMWRSGVQAEMNHAGLADGFSRLVPESSPDDPDGPLLYYALLRQTLNQTNAPTALIVNNPIRAVEKVLSPLEKLGLRCPEDISVLTMEDMDELTWCRPNLSAVAIPFSDMGALAAQQLLAMIEAGKDNASTNSIASDPDASTPALTASRLKGRVIPRESIVPVSQPD
ncbi:MAG: LacI family DNA-binding transcriptional regulator [Planctomycetota bacterium]